jgi:hypothetical protein
MAESFTVNSSSSKMAFSKYVDALFDKHKYITFDAPRVGADRSMDQNALLHAWVTEYVAHALKKDKRDVIEGEKEGMKRILKKKFTAMYPEHYSWMVYLIINPLTGYSRKDYTSSKNWKKGEMFLVLTWFQMTAAEDGLILESKGQFAKLQREHNSGVSC